MQPILKGDAMTRSPIRVEASPGPGEVYLTFKSDTGDILFNAMLEAAGVEAVGKACARALASTDGPFLLIEVPNPNAYESDEEGMQ